MTIPEGAAPNVFYKGAADAVIGPSQAIRLTSTNVDWEAELALVIGRTACAVSVDRALDCVAGYTCDDLCEQIDRLAPSRHREVNQRALSLGWAAVATGR
jgi:hypothetical protein